MEESTSTSIEKVGHIEEENLILIEVEQKIAALRDTFDRAQQDIMEKVSYWGEQETRYQRQAEPLGRQKKLIRNYLEAFKKTGKVEIDQVDLEELKRLYLEEHQQLHDDFIIGRTEFFKSRDYFYDKETSTFIKLTRENRSAMIEKFTKELGADLDAHKEKFLTGTSSCNTLLELKEYEKTLGKEVDAHNKALDDIRERKIPHMMAYNNNETKFISDKQKISNQMLFKAVEEDNIYACQAILSKYKADIYFQNKEGFSVLHLARSSAMVKFLLTQGADKELTLKYTEPLDHKGYTPLHFYMVNEYATEEMVKILLEAGANVDAQSTQGVTPLFLASKIKPNNAFIELLMEHGANIRSRNNKGHFAMGCSSSHEKDKFAETSRFTDELMGKQAARGMLAWKMVQEQASLLKLIEEKQLQFQQKLENLRQENALLRQKIVKLEDILVRDDTQPLRQVSVKSDANVGLSSKNFFTESGGTVNAFDAVKSSVRDQLEHGL